MQTSEKIEKKGGFIQPVQVSSSSGCCGSTSSGSCCGEPVQAQDVTIPTAAVSCCGEPVLQADKQPAVSSSCCG
jgi:hypothetical protein